MYLLFSSLTELASISSKMLIRNGERRDPSLVPYLRKKSLFFTVKYDASCSFL